MNVRGIYGLLGALLVLTVPWPFGRSETGSLLGFPSWALYSLGMTVLFGLTMAVVLQVGWDASAGTDADAD